MSAFDDVVPIQGFLTDHYICEALRRGFLIEKGTCDESLIRHASYMMRLGNTVHVSRSFNQSTDTVGAVSIVRLTPEKPILLLRPGETALLYSMEYMRLPPSVLALTVARGLLYTHPLVPENTYIDPGFAGSIYTVVTNISGRLVELTYGMPIARIFFYKLAEPVASPYISGAGAGVPQDLITRPLLSLSSLQECQKETWNNLLDASRQIPVPGVYVLEELLRRLQRRLGVLYVALVVWPLVLILINRITWLEENVNSIVVNVMASVVATGLIWLFVRLRDRMKTT